MPVIIEGETGVGKTTLIEMLSKLWNHALLAQWEDRRESLVDLLKQKLGGLYSMTCSTASLARRSLFFISASGEHKSTPIATSTRLASNDLHVH